MIDNSCEFFSVSTLDFAVAAFKGLIILPISIKI